MKMKEFFPNFMAHYRVVKAQENSDVAKLIQTILF